MADVQLSTLGSVIKTAYEGEANTNGVTDAEKVVLGNTSGNNTGDQTDITGNAATVTTNANLTGHVTSTGNAAVLGSFTIAQLNSALSDYTVTSTPEGTAVVSTGETGGIKFLREDGDNSSSWQEVPIPSKYVGVNNQTGTAYTLVALDAGKLVTCNNASAITLTIPANASVAYDVGTQIDVIQLGAGQVTVALTSDTLRGDTKIGAQYEAVSLVKIASTEWVIIGGTA